MNGMLAWWSRNHVAANLLMIGIIIAGIMGFSRMDREVFPTVRVNLVQVSVFWPGAAPQEVEEQIVVRIEEALVDLDNIEHLTSTARESSATIMIEANPNIDLADFLNKVKSRVDSVATLPRDVEPPRVQEIITRNSLIMMAVHGDVEPRLLKRTSEQLRDEISLLKGASIVQLQAVLDEEVSIELSEENMRRYGLTFDEVARAVAQSSINLSSGSVRTEGGRIQLRARNLADTQQEFERIIVRQTDDGAVIRVGDVATVIDGFVDAQFDARYNGEPATLLQVMTTESGMNVVETSNSVNKWLETVNDRLPPGIKVSLWFNQSKIYFDRMQTISRSALVGLLLVCIVLILFLRPAVAFWVSIGIATAFAGAFIFLPGQGVSLNMLSLFAFLLVIGIVVDDAIIVGEKIHSLVEEGHDGPTAAVLGTQLVLKPVVFAVATTMIAFAPWLFLDGVTTQFTRQISLIVIFSLMFSLVEALFILPAHLSGLKPERKVGTGIFSPLVRLQRATANSMIWYAETIYRPCVVFCVKFRYFTAALFFFFMVISINLVSTGMVKFSFNPEIENEMVRVEIDFPEGTPYARSIDVRDRVNEAVAKFEESYRAENGEDSGDIIQSVFTFAFEGGMNAFVFVAPPEIREMPVRDIALQLREYIGEIPDAEEIELDFTINSQNNRLQFSVNHRDLDVLQAAVEELKAKMRTYDALFDVRDNLTSAREEIRFTLKPGAEKLGLTLGEVSRQVRQAYFGEQVQRLPREGNDVRVYVRYEKRARQDIESLSNFRVRTPDGREIPLLSVVDIEYAPGLNRIQRRERQRSAVVTADLRDDVRSQIVQELRQDFFPQWEQRYPGISEGAIGDAEGQAEFFADIQALYIIALMVMYALLAIAFGSYVQPLIIMSAIPFSFMGAVYGHWVFQSPMALFSYFGIGAAAGVVVNDNLVLVDNVNRMIEKGEGVFHSLVESGVSRFRPIILTSVTTFVGLIPMMLERSTQAQFLKPTVISLACAVLLCTFVTLILVPALYGIGTDISRTFKRLWTGESVPGLGKGKSAEHAE